jgi:hypothetical protein
MGFTNQRPFEIIPPALPDGHLCIGRHRIRKDGLLLPFGALAPPLPGRNQVCDIDAHVENYRPVFGHDGNLGALTDLRACFDCGGAKNVQARRTV